jgi:hypothetical protein
VAPESVSFDPSPNASPIAALHGLPPWSRPSSGGAEVTAAPMPTAISAIPATRRAAFTGTVCPLCPGLASHSGSYARTETWSCGDAQHVSKPLWRGHSMSLLWGQKYRSEQPQSLTRRFQAAAIASGVGSVAMSAQLGPLCRTLALSGNHASLHSIDRRARRSVRYSTGVSVTSERSSASPFTIPVNVRGRP